MVQKTSATVKQMADKAAECFKSDKGQRDLRDLLARTEKMEADIARAARVDLDSLNKPVTL